MSWNNMAVASRPSWLTNGSRYSPGSASYVLTWPLSETKSFCKANRSDLKAQIDQVCVVLIEEDRVTYVIMIERCWSSILEVTVFPVGHVFTFCIRRGQEYKQDQR